MTALGLASGLGDDSWEGGGPPVCLPERIDLPLAGDEEREMISSFFGDENGSGTSLSSTPLSPSTASSQSTALDRAAL